MRKGYLLFVLTVGLLMSACLLTRPTGVPPTPSVTPSGTDVPTATPSPSPTPVPAPPGAGWVKDPFGVEFHTDLRDLPSGEYVVIDSGGDPQHTEHQYVGLNGQGSGPLFVLNVPPDVQVFSRLSMGISTYAQESVLVIEWRARDRTRSGLVFVDLRGKRMTQFEAGCYARFDLLLPLTDPPYFAYTCNDGQGFKGETWHVVAGGEAIRSYQFPSLSGATEMAWITPDLIAIHNEDDLSCTLQPSRGAVNCFPEVPDWWSLPASKVSPDGTLILIAYRDPLDPDQPPAEAILPVSCLQDPASETCTPRLISAPSGVRPFTGDWGGYPEQFWSPDGSKLLIFGVGAWDWPDVETAVWVYDLQRGTSKVVVRDLAVIYPGPGPWTSDGEHFLMVNTNASNDQKIWLVSSISGQMRRVAGDLTGIVDVVGIFKVP